VGIDGKGWMVEEEMEGARQDNGVTGEKFKNYQGSYITRFSGTAEHV
jgi:hypothetical protein